MPLNNQQYESIIKGYEKTRNYNRKLVEERRALLYKQCPSLVGLESSIGSLALQQTSSLLNGDNSAVSRFRQSVFSVSQQKKALLEKAGYPENYLDPIYTCPICQDTGYIRREDSMTEKCECFRRQEIALLYEQSNIRELISKENFSTLSYEYYKGEDYDRFERAVQISKRFVDCFSSDYQNLFLYGTVGTGKSFLSGCIANELLKKGVSVIYFSAVTLFDTLARYSFDTKSKETLYNFYKDLYNCDLVIIDDLGTEVTNSFVATQLFSCLNERHLRRKPTIISTNLSLEELRDRYSDRVFSRITSNYSVCKLTGPDIRMYKKRNANTFNV